MGARGCWGQDDCSSTGSPGLFPAGGEPGRWGHSPELAKGQARIVPQCPWRRPGSRPFSGDGPTPTGWEAPRASLSWSYTTGHSRLGWGPGSSQLFVLTLGSNPSPVAHQPPGAAKVPQRWQRRPRAPGREGRAGGGGREAGLPRSRQQGWAERSRGSSGQCWTRGPHLEAWRPPAPKQFSVFAMFSFHCHFKASNCCKR